jgi:hypothetical protein
MRFFWALVGIGLVSLVAAASLAQVGLILPPKIREFDIPTIEKLASDMYVQDQHAWKATAALLSQHPQAELLQEKVRGWLVDDRDGVEVVRFVRDGTNGPEAAYDVSFGSLRQAAPDVSVPQDRTLSASERAKFAARSLAVRNITQRCSTTYNTIVLKDPSGEGWIVWVMAATTDPDAIMMGVHYRFTISADGSRIISQDALARGCLAIKKTQNGQTASAIGMTQIVSNIPVETTLFASLQHNMMFLILTADGGQWQVAGGHIARLGTMQQSPPQQVYVSNRTEEVHPVAEFARRLN